MNAASYRVALPSCRKIAIVALSLALCTTLARGAELWELPPLRYADTPATDPIARLARELAAAKRQLAGATPLDRVKAVLELLEIPVSSQVLVFSKTSKQNHLITPAHPRAVFFNENAYLGYVPGGLMEIITHDAALGVVFHTIDPGDAVPAAQRIRRDTGECLSCHATARTESVPGVLVRSVFPDANGQPILPHGSFLINHHSPIAERWGGYIVTGTSSLPHLGNRTFTEVGDRPSPAAGPPPADLTNITAGRLPASTSDIVALMVLEHQCAVHNQLTAAAYQYRRAAWLQHALDPKADPSTGSPGHLADQASHRIVDLLLFKDEAPLGADGIDGEPAYQQAFTSRHPKAPDGRSLADFHLTDRLFKYRGSFMVYSKAFHDLPPRVKSAVLARLRLALADSASGIATHLPAPERARVDAILRATLPGYGG